MVWAIEHRCWERLRSRKRRTSKVVEQLQQLSAFARFLRSEEEEELSDYTVLRGMAVGDWKVSTSKCLSLFMSQPSLYLHSRISHSGWPETSPSSGSVAKELYDWDNFDWTSQVSPFIIELFFIKKFDLRRPLQSLWSFLTNLFFGHCFRQHRDMGTPNNRKLPQPPEGTCFWFPTSRNNKNVDLISLLSSIVWVISFSKVSAKLKYQAVSPFQWSQSE